MTRYAVGADGWCEDVTRYDSPNVDARPPGTGVTLLVIHNISLPGGQFGTPHVSDLFTGRVDYNAHPSFADLRGLKVSSHFFIRRDGRVLQYAAADARAWHAGKSEFRGRSECNDFSIGVELEGSDLVPFEAPQYAALAALTLALQMRYPLADVQGHEHIAPGRKTDPGPWFDWRNYHEKWTALLKEKAVAEPALVTAYRGLRFPYCIAESQ